MKMNEAKTSFFKKIATKVVLEAKLSERENEMSFCRIRPTTTFMQMLMMHNSDFVLAMR